MNSALIYFGLSLLTSPVVGGLMAWLVAKDFLNKPTSEEFAHFVLVHFFAWPLTTAYLLVGLGYQMYVNKLGGKDE